MLDLDELGRRLTDLQLVTDAQWADAVGRAGPGGLTAALDLLTRARAPWSPPGDRSPALTAYQVKQIARCAEDDDLSKLDFRVRWNDYLLLDELGRGGMGVVMKGWDVANGRYVAIKRNRKDKDTTGDAQKRLAREAKLFSKLDHPKIARFYAWEQFLGSSLLVLEFIPGRTLKDMVDGRGPSRPVPWTAVAEWASDLLECLEYAHGGNPAGLTVIHRDIKPSNVMLQLAPDGKRYGAKLLDFGLGKAMADEGGDANASVGEELTKKFELIGTFQYMAPEQWRGGSAGVGPPADLYCLGGTLFFALTGRPPYDASDMTEYLLMHTSDPPPVVRKLRSDVPIHFDLLLRKMMDKSPDQRGTAAGLRAELHQILAKAAATSGSTTGARPAPAPGGELGGSQPHRLTPAAPVRGLDDPGTMMEPPRPAAGGGSKPQMPAVPPAAPPPPPARSPAASGSTAGGVVGKFEETVVWRPDMQLPVAPQGTVPPPPPFAPKPAAGAKQVKPKPQPPPRPPGGGGSSSLTWALLGIVVLLCGVVVWLMAGDQIRAMLGMSTGE